MKNAAVPQPSQGVPGTGLDTLGTAGQKPAIQQVDNPFGTAGTDCTATPSIRVLQRTPIRCESCGHRIGEERLHFIIEPGDVLCGNCMERKGQHARYYPGCRQHWHDMWDHDVSMTDRACARLILDRRGASDGRDPASNPRALNDARDQLTEKTPMNHNNDQRSNTP